jgi:DnaJ homolog subfamily C member 28
MDPWRFIADRKIREAMDEGAFDDLPGAGQPLPEEATGGDPALWMAHHIMKDSGVVPVWIAEGNVIEAEIERLRRLMASACAVNRHRLADEVAALNRRISAFNLIAPEAVHKLPFSL